MKDTIQLKKEELMAKIVAWLVEAEKDFSVEAWDNLEGHSIIIKDEVTILISNNAFVTFEKEGEDE